MPESNPKRLEDQTLAAEHSSGVATAPTLVAEAPPLPAGAAASGAGSGTGSSSLGASAVTSTSLTALGPTPAETLYYEEIQRTRAFLVIAVVMAALVAVTGPLLSADAFARSVLLSGMFVICASSGWLLFQMRKDAGYTLGRGLAAAYAAVYGALAGIYFFGAFSPAPVVLPFGVFFSACRRASAPRSRCTRCAQAASCCSGWEPSPGSSPIAAWCALSTFRASTRS